MKPAERLPRVGARFAHASVATVSTSMVATVSVPSKTASLAFRPDVRRHAGLPTCCFRSGTNATSWASMAKCLASRNSKRCLALAVVSPITRPPRPRPG